MRCIAATVIVALAVASCAETTDGIASSPDLGRSAPSTRAVEPQLVRLGSAEAFLLKPVEIGEIIDDTEVVAKVDYSKVAFVSTETDPPACAPRLTFLRPSNSVDSQGFSGFGSVGTRRQFSGQLITVYPDRKQPLAAAGAIESMLRDCANGQVFSTTGEDVTQRWTATPVTRAQPEQSPRAGAGSVRNGEPARTCYHVVTAQANVTVEVITCGDGDSAGQANQILDRIVAGLPA